MADIIKTDLQPCDSSSCISETTVQIQLNVISICVHVHSVLLDFVGKVRGLEDKKTQT